MPFDPQISPLAQVGAAIAEHPMGEWTQALAGQPAEATPAQELATLLLAVNYELIGYSPEHAWMFARRGEAGAPGGYVQ